mmetsp:Transcript_95479/g.307815  ORF Transcript_95479/g.307815 Transcript_95479/m.307815 type:complete len:234 (+) Transcript_95479:92-793(+)
MLRRLRGWVGWGGGEVSMPKLVAALKSSTGVSVDGPEQLLDFSLLTDEVDQIAAEKSALGDSFVHWPTFGVVPAAFQKACREYDVAECPSTMQPGNMTAENVHTLAKAFPKWDVDHLAERVEILHSRLHEDLDGLDLARVIFFHCSCGCDRTGELAAAYSMRYLNQTFTEMYVENAKVAGRNTVGWVAPAARCTPTRWPHSGIASTCERRACTQETIAEIVGLSGALTPAARS